MPLISATPFNVSPILGYSISEGDPWPIYIRPDGQKFYIGLNNDAEVHQYSMSSAFSITSASYDSLSADVSDGGSGGSNPLGLTFSTDGTKMYICGNTSTDQYYSYTLSTAWNVSTATYDSVTLTAAGSNPRAFNFKSDGLRIISLENAVFRSYTLSSAWDLSTALYDSKFFSVSSQDTDPLGLAVTSDGFTIYIAGYQSDAVHRYTLGTAWDVTTASHAETISIDTGIVASAAGFALNNTETEYFVVNSSSGGAGQGVYQFSL